MKKLILVTLLAFAASWVLSETRQANDERAMAVAAIEEFKAKSPDRPSQILVLDNGQTIVAPVSPVAPVPLVPPVAPVPPVPPSPPAPSSIRTIPWRPSDASRPNPAPKANKTVPAWFPKSDSEEEVRAEKADGFGSRVLLGRLSASEDRARQDLRQIVEREVSDWLAADVPTSWRVPAGVLTSMVQASHVQEVTRSLAPIGSEADPAPGSGEIPGLDGLYTLYRAGQKLDFSPNRRAQIVAMYRHDLATQRLQRLGGGLALALVGLAVLSGYIKADEATKGYYTNRLRLAAAAGLGAAGVAAYRFLV